MFKQINIMLCFLLFFAFDQATAQANFKIFSPNFIPSNGSFEISIITSKKFPEAEKLNIFISPDLSLIINKIILLTNNENLEIPFQSGFLEEYSEQFQKISLDLTDTARFSDGDFFQIIINLKSTSVNSNNLKFFGEFLRGDELLGYLVNSESKINSDTDHIFNLSFNYYQKYSTAGDAASLIQGSYLNIPLVYNFDEVLALEFWMKEKNSSSTFLEIINWETNRVEYSLSINDNQMLTLSSMEDELLLIKFFFISQNVWYHLNINFEKEKSELSFFCDGNELARFKVQNKIEFDNLVLHFQNEKQNGEVNLDQLRVINLNQSSSALNRNKNYVDYSDDSSNVILQMNFNDIELINLLNNKTISYEKVRLIKSDAPIFPKSPQINVRLSDNFYEIEWEGGSYEDAVQYVLERAIDNNDFIGVGKVAADNNLIHMYSLLSEKIEQYEIVYFRIKQINKDGSVIYSDAIKVGQGIVDDLIIGQNYPNPFNPTTLIEFELIQDSDVEVRVYNLAGKEIALLHRGFLSRGVHQFVFDASGFSSGVYLYQITTPLSSQTRKMILTK
ncbi:MAG: T9SS type A sorting domain-containing protein [Ignavibacteria bacterium]|nr:T9SS type A sorting domain-containing protein [Ignavibacteria bacterium]